MSIDGSIHGAQCSDTLDVAVENIIFKIHQYLHIYTVHTENLKENCEFVDTGCRSLLSQQDTMAVTVPRC